MLGNLKSRLQSGQPIVGTLVKIPALSVVEILGEIGYDFVILDMRHSSFSFENVEAMVTAADSVRMGSIVRVQDKEDHSIFRALDVGCDGVQVPMIENSSDALISVKAARYHPLGNRSLSFASRAAHYSCIERKEHIQKSNQDQLIAVAIESWKAVEQAESIASIEGVDVLFVGRADLSNSLGVPGQSSHPKVMEGIRIVGLAAQKYGKALGAHVGVVDTLADLEKIVNYGVTYVVYSTDVVLFVRGAEKGLEELKQALKI
jgi:4-hydroxy-2-oxoheptanedioate aldolase